MAGELDHAAVGREVAAQDREAAGRLDRVVSGRTTSWPSVSAAPSAISPIVRPVTVMRVLVQQAGVLEALEHERARRPPRTGRGRRTGRPASGRTAAACARRSRRSRRSSARRPFRARPPAGAARRWWSRRCMATAAIAFSSAALRDDRRSGAGPRSARPSPARRTRSATSSLRPSSAGTIAEPAGEMPSTSKAIAIVLAVNWPPQAPAPGEATSSSSCSSLLGDLARRRGRRRPRTPRWIVTSSPLVAAGHDRAAVEHQRSGCPGGASAITVPGIVLSQPRDRDDARRTWCASSDQLDRVGDQLAGDQRGAHARRCPS